MEVGPVELVVLTFPEERADADVVAAIADVVSQGYVTLLDLIYLARTADGWIKIVYEHTSARRLRTALVAAGGELALHVRIPPDTVDAAVAAAT